MSETFKTRVVVHLKAGVLDPQGEAVRQSLGRLGYDVGAVRVGKVVDLELQAKDQADAERLAKEMADKLLANPVIERFDVSEL